MLMFCMRIHIKHEFIGNMGKNSMNSMNLLIHLKHEFICLSEFI